MPVIEQQLSQKPVAADAGTIAEFLNRELVPVVRRMRAVLNSSGTIAATTFGDGVASVYDIAHPFGTRDVLAQAYDNITGQELNPINPIQRLNVDTIRISIGFVAPVNRYRMLILG